MYSSGREREQERERESARERKKERESERERMPVTETNQRSNWFFIPFNGK